MEDQQVGPLADQGEQTQTEQVVLSVTAFAAALSQEPGKDREGQPAGQTQRQIEG